MLLNYLLYLNCAEQQIFTTAAKIFTFYLFVLLHSMTLLPSRILQVNEVTGKCLFLEHDNPDIPNQSSKSGRGFLIGLGQGSG